jgi:hypothetical protein
MVLDVLVHDPVRDDDRSSFISCSDTEQGLREKQQGRQVTEPNECLNQVMRDVVFVELPFLSGMDKRIEKKRSYLNHSPPRSFLVIDLYNAVGDPGILKLIEGLI